MPGEKSHNLDSNSASLFFELMRGIEALILT